MSDGEAEARSKGGNAMVVIGWFGFGGDADDGPGGGTDGGGGEETDRTETATDD